MITADLHTHTLYSHGQDTPAAMWESAQKKGITLMGFSEHSPRPTNYTYSNEYREKLMRSFPQYVAEVQELKRQFPGQVLLGIEMDWMEKEEAFIKEALSAYDFDYTIGSVHFLDTWGYDDLSSDWMSLKKGHCNEHYVHYFKTLRRMAESGLFNIAAHLDLIKIFSIDTFNAWIQERDSLLLVAEALQAMMLNGMALEISSAGLRKMCKEIYPCPHIMALAKELHLPIAFASDAHNVHDVAADFDKLEAYARAYGYEHSVYFCKNKMYKLPF